MSRTLKKIAFGLTAMLVVASGIGYLMRAELSARFTAYQLRSTSDESTRQSLAGDLVSCGSASITTIVDLLKTGTPEVRMAVIEAVGQRPADDPLFAPATFAVLDAIEFLDDDSIDEALALTPKLASDPARAERAKAAVAIALKGTVSAKVAACRVATRSGIDLASAVVPLLADTNASVRQAAVIAIGPSGSEVAVVSEEDLFKLLSDPDGDVRTVTAAALGTRGLNDRQIALGRKLVHADVKERMSLLLDLKFAGESIKDVGPWLARLGRDADPAVRAGAARMAFECRVSSMEWLSDLADRDPDPLVRQVAGHYRKRTNDVRTAGGFERQDEATK